MKVQSCKKPRGLRSSDFSVTKEELARQTDALLADSEQLEDKSDNVSAVDYLDFVMESDEAKGGIMQPILGGRCCFGCSNS